jgi:4'-phosphopantetheinyl transferase
MGLSEDAETVWCRPPEVLGDPGNEVHVWRIGLDAPDDAVRRVEHTLSADEQARADRYHFPRDRARFILGRAGLRACLARYLGIEPADVRFQYGPEGKPGLALEGTPQGLRFNLAHSAGLALLGVARDRELGIDIEALRPMDDADGVAARICSARELADYRALPDSERLLAFFRCWTRKEAYVKALGRGLSMALDRCQVSLRPGEPPRLLEVDGNPAEVERWSLCELHPAPGFVGTLVAEGRGWTIRCWDDQAPGGTGDPVHS